VIFPVSAGWCCLLASTKNLGVPVSDSVCDMCERLDPLPRSATGLASTLPRLSRAAWSHKLPVSFVRLGRPLRRPRLRAAWLTTESDDDDGYRDGNNNGNSSGSDAIEQRRCGRSTTQQRDRPPRPTWGNHALQHAHAHHHSHIMPARCPSPSSSGGVRPRRHWRAPLTPALDENRGKLARSCSHAGSGLHQKRRRKLRGWVAASNHEATHAATRTSAHAHSPDPSESHAFADAHLSPANIT